METQNTIATSEETLDFELLKCRLAEKSTAQSDDIITGGIMDKHGIMGDDVHEKERECFTTEDLEQAISF